MGIFKTLGSSTIRILLFLLKFVKRVIWSVVKLIHKKKRRYIPFYLVLSYVVFIILLVKFSGDPEFSTVLSNKRINDVTTINPIQVNKEIQPKTTEEIVRAILTTTGTISVGGGRFSMGGQIGFENSLHIDMRHFNKVVSLDETKKQVTVQTGITWRELQNKIDKHDLSVKIMQTYANFTVGGSISVNCHGRYIGHGPIISSVMEM